MNGKFFKDVEAFDEPFHLILNMLNVSGLSCLILATTEDDAVRQEATALYGEELTGRYHLAEFDFTEFDNGEPGDDAPVRSLMRQYRWLSGSADKPVCLFAHGLDVLKARNPPVYEEVMHFLNAHREDLTLAPGAVFLWLTRDTWKDIYEMAPDLADWESVDVTFELPPGVRLERTALGRLSVRDAEDQRDQVRRFKEMLSRPGLGVALTDEFQKQLDYSEKLLGRRPDPRRDYRLLLMDELREHVLGGFAPRVGGRDLSLPLSKVFLPLRSVEGRPALSEYAEEDLDWQERMAGRELSELDWQTRREEVEKRRARLHHRQLAERSFTMQELLSEPRAVLLGDPGSGKSTVARYVAWTLAAEEYQEVGDAVRGRLPVLVRLANFGKALDADRELTLLGYVETQLIPERSEAFGSALREAIEAGECLVILDGLDEVTDPDLRADVTRRIQSFVHEHSENRFLVTSRIVGYDRSPLTQEFRHATLQPLEAEDQKRFIGLWYSAFRVEIRDRDLESREADLIDALEKKPQIARMAANPLLLTIMVLMHWRGFKLPSRRVQIYQNATDTLIEYWTQERVALDAEEVKQLLAPVAWYILSSNVGGVIARDDLLPRLRDGLVAQRGCEEEEAGRFAEEILTALSEQSGIFLERGHDSKREPVYGFLHQTFAEYLAALHLADLFLEGSFEVGKYVHREAWREPLLLMAGHLALFSQRHATRLLQEILDCPCPYEDILHRNTLFAAECLADDIQVAPKVRDEVVKGLADVLLDPVEKPREAAMELYRSLGRSRHREAALGAVRAVTLARESAAPLEYEATLGLAAALIRLGARNEAEPLLTSCDEARQTETLRLRVEGWLEQAEELILAEYDKHKLHVHCSGQGRINLGPFSEEELCRILGSDRYIKLLERLHEAEGDDKFLIHWILLRAWKYPSTSEVLKLAEEGRGQATWRVLAARDLLKTEYRDVGVKILGEIARSGHTRAAEILVEESLQDQVDWGAIKRVALTSLDPKEAIHLLLEAEMGDTAFPALFLHLLRRLPFIEPLSILSALHDTNHFRLADLISRWLALLAGDQFRLDACNFLVENGRVEEAIPLLRAVAYECHDHQSGQACRLLLAFREIDSVAPVLRQLVAGSDPNLRYEAASALALVPDTSGPRSHLSRSQLKAIGLADRYRLNRQVQAELYEAGLSTLRQATGAIASLGRWALTFLCGRSEALEGVSKSSADGDPFIAQDLALADLIEGRAQQARERLAAITKDGDPSYAMRVAAHGSAALGMRIDRLGFQVLATRKPKGLTQYFLSLASSIAELQEVEFNYLASVASPAVIDYLKASFPEFPEESRRDIILRLRESRDPAANVIILQATKDPAPLVRQASIGGWVGTGDRPILADLLADSKPLVRGAAIDALARLAEPADHPTLLSSLADDSAFVRESAVDAVSRLSISNLTGFLLQSTTDTSPQVRAAAIRGLGLHAALTFEELRVWLGDPRVRGVAVGCLGRFSQSGTLLMDFLGDENSNVRAQACRSLSRLKAVDVPALPALLNDDSFLTRTFAADALGRRKDANAIEPLILALGNPFFWERRSSALALARLGHRDAIRNIMVRGADLLLAFDSHAPGIVSALARLDAKEALPLLVTCIFPNRKYLGALLPLDPQSVLDAFDRFEFPLEFHGWPHWLRGHAHWRLHGPEKAGPAFVEAVEKHATIENLLTLALFRLEEKNLDDAEALVERALATYWDTEEEWALCFLTRAVVRRHRGDLVAALEDVRKATWIDSFVTDLQDLEFDHLWRPSALRTVEELVGYIERDAVNDELLSEVAEPETPYQAG